MKIALVPAQAKGVEGQPQESQVVTLEVSGDIDPTNPVVVRARQLIENTGSQEMLESFDWAVRNQVLSADR